MDSIQLLKKGRIGVCLRKTIVGVCFFLMAFVSNRLFAGSIANGLTLKNAGVTAPISIFKFTSAATQCAKSNLFTVYNGSNFKLGFTYTWDFGDGSTLQTSTAFTAATLPTDTAKNSLFAPSHSYISAGTYTIKLIVTNVSGTQATSSAVVTVAASPVVSFTASTSVAGTTNANIISFSSTSTLLSGNMSYAWSFGNTTATSLITSNPVDTFKAANGSALPVTLKVTNSIGGCASSLTKNITVYAPYKPTTPTAKFALNSVADTQCLATNSYKFTNSSAKGSDIKYKWSFGDTATVSYSEAVPPAHKYALPGVYTVTLTVSNTLGTAQTSTLAVTVAASPVVNFTASTSVAGTTNANIISFSSTSTLLSGNMSYAWSFGNTTATSLITSNPVDTFKAANGSALPVTLKVTNSIGGCASSLTKNITVYAPYKPTTPTAKFALNSVADTQCLATNSYKFTNSSATGSDIKYKWSFGDTATVSYSEAVPPAHKYALPGVYTVTLTVSNTLGTAQTSTLAVTVAASPVVSFTASTSVAGTTNANIISFSSTSTLLSGNMSYAWNFGNTTATSFITSNPVDTFKAASGSALPVKLTVTNSIGGCASSLTKNITVYPAYVPTTLNPSLSLYYVADSQCLASNKYTFNYGLLNPDVKAVIDFGDGTPAYSGTQYGQLAPLTGGHTYAKPGVYTVKLTQTNLLNDSKTVTLSVTVAPNPVASFVYQSNTGNGENDSYSFSSTSTLSAGNLSYAWDFGDANDPNKLNTSKLSNPDHVFLTASYPYNVNNTLAYTTYIVKLTATSSIAGCSSAVTKTINVYPGTEGYSVVNKNTLAQEALASSKVSISPNPASSTLKVSFVATTSKVNIKVVDLLGRVVKSVNQSANVGSNNTVQVDVSNLSSGTYVLKVSNEQGNTISSSQFVKLAK